MRYAQKTTSPTENVAANLSRGQPTKQSMYQSTNQSTNQLAPQRTSATAARPAKYAFAASTPAPSRLSLHKSDSFTPPLGLPTTYLPEKPQPHLWAPSYRIYNRQLSPHLCPVLGGQPQQQLFPHRSPNKVALRELKHQPEPPNTLPSSQRLPLACIWRQKRPFVVRLGIARCPTWGSCRDA